MATLKYQPPRGEENHFARYTEAAVARAKRLIADAPRVSVIAPGEMDRIAGATGIGLYSLRRIANGSQWGHVEPAEASDV